MNREELLAAARAVVMGPREAQYGPPDKNFKCIADLWSAYLGVPIATHDVAAMMVLMKTTRLRETPTHTDSWVDIAGYAACGAEIATKEKDYGQKLEAAKAYLGTKYVLHAKYVPGSNPALKHPGSYYMQKVREEALAKGHKL